MASLKPLLKKLLKERQTTLEAVNKRGNQKLKTEVLNDLMRVAIIDSRSKSKKGNPLVGESIKQVRATGLKFRNEQAREIFYERTEKHFKSSYVTSLKANYKPNPKKLPFLQTSEVKGGYLYAARIYLKSTKKKENVQKVPNRTKEGHVIRMKKDNLYAKTGKYAFWSDEPIEKSKVLQIFKDLFSGKDESDLVNEYVIDSSNTSDIDFKRFIPIAFLYTGALRT